MQYIGGLPWVPEFRFLFTSCFKGLINNFLD